MRESSRQWAAPISLGSQSVYGTTADTRLARIFQRLDDQFSSVLTWNSKHGNELAKRASIIYEVGRYAVLCIMCLSLLLITLSSTRITALITKPLSRVTAAAKGLAEGDVAQVIALERADEVGQLSATFRSLISYQSRMAAAAESIATGDSG